MIHRPLPTQPSNPPKMKINWAKYLNSTEMLLLLEIMEDLENTIPNRKSLCHRQELPGERPSSYGDHESKDRTGPEQAGDLYRWQYAYGRADGSHVDSLSDKPSLANYGKDAQATRLVDTRTFYLRPKFEVDASDVRTLLHGRRLARPSLARRPPPPPRHPPLLCGGRPARVVAVDDAATPADLQSLRQLQPVLKEILQDCRLKITFEAYNPLWSGTAQYPGQVHKRGTIEPSNVYTLIDVSGENLDLLGRSVLENEEVMLDLLKGRPEGPNLNGLVLSRQGNVLSANNDPRLPLYYVGGLDWTSQCRRFAALEFHRKKYFDGKLVSQGGSVKE